jgi:polyhydroxyalkanoate synthesis regulator phasin
MARIGLNKSDVKACRDQLQAAGRYPSVDAVRHVLGTGSKSTIHRYLKELSDEDSHPGIKRDDTARNLQAMIEQLAGQLHDDAERRYRALYAEHLQAMQDKEQELAALRSTVERLTARVEELEIDAYTSQPHEHGFGNFSHLHASSRGGLNDSTPFSMVLSGGRASVFDVDSQPIQLSRRAYPG